MRAGMLAAVSIAFATSAQARHQHMPGMVMPDPMPQVKADRDTPPSPQAATTAPARPAASGAEPAPAMDHAAMGHGGHVEAAPASVPTVETPPLPDAGTGPARAADRIWGADAMRASRVQLRREQGGQTFAALIVDRFEHRVRQGDDGYLWDADAWIGGDIDKLWIKTEGEGDWNGRAVQAEVQALWSHAIGPWFDLQAGIRQDLAGPDRTSLAIGVQGLAPYQFDVDVAAFVSTDGDVSARIEAELDQRITQRLRLQPRAELNLAAQDDPGRNIGAGIDSIEIGLRLRYEFVREFAPYIGVTREWRIGRSARYARAAEGRSNARYLVAGIRFWF